MVPQLGLLAEYFTTKRPSTRRTLRRSVRYPVALPLAVNVQDFFRKDCLLSKFTVTTDGARALRIRSAELEPVEGVVVRPCRSLTAPAVVVNPGQTATFLFKVIRQGEAPFPAATRPLRLVLTYASLEDGLRARVRAAVDAALGGDGEWAPDRRWFEEQVAAEVRRGTGVGELVGEEVGEFDEEGWVAKAARAFGEGRREGAARVARSAWEGLGHEQGEAGGWRRLVIPVDLPALDVSPHGDGTGESCAFHELTVCFWISNRSSTSSRSHRPTLAPSSACPFP